MFNNTYPNHFFPKMPMYPMMPGTPTNSSAMPDYPQDAEPETPITVPPNFEILPPPPVQDDINYTQGYLKSKIGQYVKIEFLIGTNLFIDREGILKDVGISYVVIQEPETDNELMADIYSIKFVEVFK